MAGDARTASETAASEAMAAVADRRVGDRRNVGLRSLMYGGVRPRRRAGRRAADEHQVLLDWHAPKPLYLALAILLMSCLDALLTLNILTAGGRELNGLMDHLIRMDREGFVAVKIAITGIGVVLLAIAVNRHFLGRVRVIRLLELFCAGYAALVGWELYLLAGMFPGFAETVIRNWADTLL